MAMEINNYIVTTTINAPTEAIYKYSKIKNWKLIVVGDKKTPHEKFRKLKNIIYLGIKEQEKISKKLSDIIGWNCIQRRNMGFLYAHQNNCKVLATVDDDNIPKKDWGQNIFVNKEILCNIYNDKIDFFDPLSVTNNKNLWHRGFPIQLIRQRNPKIKERTMVKCLVQADLWDGDPDIDAICRILKNPTVKFTKVKPFSTNLMTPFNSQNTFISGSILKHYMMLPFIGRMDDIWGAYYLQHKLKRKNPFIVFSNSSVVQKRNAHDLNADFNKEIIGYKYSQYMSNLNYLHYLPKQAKQFIKIYQNNFK